MDQFYNKHYIKVLNSFIIDGFSDAFQTPIEIDICIMEKGERQFELLGKINPPLVDLNRCHLYKYVDGVIAETTTEERATELANLTKTNTRIIKDKVNNITTVFTNMMKRKSY